MRLLIEVMRTDGRRRWVHAFPSVENEASNAVCRKVGFQLVGQFDFEYPAGHPLLCNDWRFDLESPTDPS
jgi:RimJ/RimL family protein N-acetyltransferase